MSQDDRYPLLSTGDFSLRSKLRLLGAELMPFLAILVTVIAFLNRAVFSNLILARGDVFLYFYPYWHAAAEALKSSRLPLWNDALFMGAPFLANIQAGLLYPLNWPFWWALTTPEAIKASIVLHLVIAGWGAYWAARRCLELNRAASVFAAILFALGGYLTAQVEHINQLQGLSWLPWYFVVAASWQRSERDTKSTTRFIGLVATLIALQILAGHTQTVFITMTALLIWVAATESQERSLASKRMLATIAGILAAALLALLVAGVQTAPTAELLAHSSRQGGLSTREALSFSLHPLIVTRSLLPQYTGALFTEYAAFLPVTALILAAIGAWGWRRDRRVMALGLLALTGFIFSLGMFSPIYQVLVRLPVFDFFRVPARWLALYAFGTALLAGAGLESLLSPRDAGARRSAIIVGTAAIIALIAWSFLSAYLTTLIATGSEIDVRSPELATWLMWIGELFLAAFLVSIVARKWGQPAFILLFAITAIVLFAFSRTLPYNQLTTPEAFYDFRPPSERIQAHETCSEGKGECRAPSSRMLSLSNIFFDPGDLPEIRTAYAGLLSEESLYDYSIAIKQKEILSPDLPMVYGIHSVDGFDGGLLPLADYSSLVSLVLPDDASATDGRLREYLEEVPEDKWLDLFNARYLITDKVGDEWRAGVFFDKQQPLLLEAANPVTDIGYVPEFMSTEIRLISSERHGLVEVSFESGGKELLKPEPIDDALFQVRWSEPAVPKSIDFLLCDSARDQPKLCTGSWRIEAASLVDDAAEVFMPLALGQYRLIHSGDVKIYENLDVLPRAFLVNHWLKADDVASSIALMNAPDFDPRSTATVIGLRNEILESSRPGSVEYLEYEAEKFSLRVSSDEGGLLVITDAFYPGWKATIDGVTAEILQSDGLFRGLLISPGRHDITMQYEPTSLKVGLVMTSLGIAILLSLFAISFSKKVKRPAKKAL